MSLHFAAPREMARGLVLLFLLTIPVWAPLTRPGLPASLAGPLPALRLAAVEEGRAPLVAEAPDAWRNDGPWPYIAARVWRGLGGDRAGAVKWSLGLALMGLALGSWGWARKWAGPDAGVFAALLALYAPLLLSAVYQQVALAAVWVAAGLALAGWGLMRGYWRGGLLAGVGAFIAAASIPVLGVLTALALLLPGLSRIFEERSFAARAPQQRRAILSWSPVLPLIVGAGGGLLFAAPWSRPATPPPATNGPALYQLIEPGWPFNVTALSREAPLSFSLGLPLLAFFLIAFWLWLGGARSEVRSSESDALVPALSLTGPLALSHFLIPLILLALSLSPLSLLPSLTPLLALPFMAVAASAALRFLPDLRRPAIYAALLIFPLLAAGPGLSPTFETLEIPAQPVAIFGDNQIILLDIKMEGAPEPGATITLDAHWFAPRPVNFDYNIFVQALDSTQTVRAQIDQQPQNGARPMTSWLPGETIADRYQLTIPADAPSDLRLVLGLYNWQTLERLPIKGRDADQIEIEE